MRLLQLNAWTMRLQTRVIDMIDQEAPDIITFQEVLESEYDLNFFPTLSQLGKQIRFNHTFFSPVYGLTFSGRYAEFGNAVISSLALHEQETFFTNLSYIDEMHPERDDYNIRNFQHVVIEDQDGNNIHVINHHGYHMPEHKDGNDLTLKACQQIVNYTEKLNGPIIIAGDFNLHPTSKSIALLNAKFKNLTQEFNLKTTRTDLTHKTEACDYIFVSDHIQVNEFYASSIVASDHQALVLDFKVARV